MSIDDISPTPEDLDFKGITSRYADIEGVVIDPGKVPERFRHLIDYAKFWSIGDDVERADMMWLTPHEDLKGMALAVRPLDAEIWEWCEKGRRQTPVPDEIVVFDMLHQAAAEATALHVDTED
jgi:hypothetical protein